MYCVSHLVLKVFLKTLVLIENLKPPSLRLIILKNILLCLLIVPSIVLMHSNNNKEALSVKHVRDLANVTEYFPPKFVSLLHEQ